MKVVLSTNKGLFFHKWQLYHPQIRVCFSTHEGRIVHKEGLVFPQMTAVLSIHKGLFFHKWGQHCPQRRVCFSTRGSAYVSTTQCFESPQVWDELSTIARLFSDKPQVASGMFQVLLGKVFKAQQWNVLKTQFKFPDFVYWVMRQDLGKLRSMGLAAAWRTALIVGGQVRFDMGPEMDTLIHSCDTQSVSIST